MLLVMLSDVAILPLKTFANIHQYLGLGKSMSKAGGYPQGLEMKDSNCCTLIKVKQLLRKNSTQVPSTTHRFVFLHGQQAKKYGESFLHNACSFPTPAKKTFAKCTKNLCPHLLVSLSFVWQSLYPSICSWQKPGSPSWFFLHLSQPGATMLALKYPDLGNVIPEPPVNHSHCHLSSRWKNRVLVHLRVSACLSPPPILTDHLPPSISHSLGSNLSKTRNSHPFLAWPRSPRWPLLNREHGMLHTPAALNHFHVLEWALFSAWNTFLALHEANSYSSLSSRFRIPPGRWSLPVPPLPFQLGEGCSLCAPRACTFPALQGWLYNHLFTLFILPQNFKLNESTFHSVLVKFLWSVLGSRLVSRKRGRESILQFSSWASS